MVAKQSTRKSRHFAGDEKAYLGQRYERKLTHKREERLARKQRHDESRQYTKREQKILAWWHSSEGELRSEIDIEQVWQNADTLVKQVEAYLSTKVVCDHCQKEVGIETTWGSEDCGYVCRDEACKQHYFVNEGGNEIHRKEDFYGEEEVQCVCGATAHIAVCSSNGNGHYLCPGCQRDFAWWNGVAVPKDIIDWLNSDTHSAVYPEDVCTCSGCRNGYGICSYRGEVG